MVELMLAMAFISVLLIVISMTVIQISHIYNKGITLREVNQTGRAISEDLTRTISGSAPFDIGSGPDSQLVTRDGGAAGRLCVGRVTYAWNTGSNTSNGSDVRFVKINDPGGSLCRQSPWTDIQVGEAFGSTDLLRAGDRDLVMHYFSVAKTADDPANSQALYALRFVIGTKESEFLNTNNTACRPPSETDSYAQSHCAVNRFEVLIRAGNKGSDSGGGA